jgi:hypothetical protein
LFFFTKIGTKSVVSMERKTLESEASHENSKFLTEPKHTDQAEIKVPVIYYLSTNGQLQHPHLIHVSISSPHGTLRLQGKSSTLLCSKEK